MKKYEPSALELRDEWERVEAFWDKMAVLGEMIDYPWTRARFNLAIFNTMLSQRNWKVPTMLGGRPGGV